MNVGKHERSVLAIKDEMHAFAASNNECISTMERYAII